MTHNWRSEDRLVRDIEREDTKAKYCPLEFAFFGEKTNEEGPERPGVKKRGE
jgi:hypothetical protein